MDAFFHSPGLTWLYVVLLGIGVVYALLILIGGGLTDFELPGADVDVNVDAGGLKLPALSPVGIASFVTAFGASGLIGLRLFNVSGPASMAWAIIGGVGVAIAAHTAFIYFLIAPQGSSEVRLRDIVGAVAEVTTAIPATGVGEVAFVAQGGRLTYTARSANGTALARGAPVVIEKVVGGVAVVRPQV